MGFWSEGGIAVTTEILAWESGSALRDILKTDDHKHTEKGL